MRSLAIALLAGLAAVTLPAQLSSHPLLWKAQWISHPTAPLREPIVLRFRFDLELPRRPDHYIVHLSADNRFVFYVNGKRVGDGPARGDLDHWRFETFDLASELQVGHNTLAATVWNFGIYSPIAQISDRTAFVLQGDSELEAAANTGPKWMVEVEPGWRPLPRPVDGNWEYMAAGFGEVIDTKAVDWQWMTEPTDQGNWVSAGPAMREIIFPNPGTAVERGQGPADAPWQLVPDTLPPMSYLPEDAGHLVRIQEQTQGTIATTWLAPTTANQAPQPAPALPITIQPHHTTRLLFDRSELTTGYPELRFSGGEGAKITVTYAEALYDSHHLKGNRNEVADRLAIGLHDEIHVNEGSDHSFEPLWWRTWRYAEVKVETAEAPVTIQNFSAHLSAYPYNQLASFTSSDKQLNQIWQTGWHTVELASHETYMDTPYWEQLQYVGDTRIEALITYAVTGDNRLPDQALEAFNDSRVPDGLTKSRGPASLEQMIPTFSLQWIDMVHDAWRYQSDTALIQKMLPGTRTVLEWYRPYQDADGLLHRLPWWSFIDWVGSKKPFPSYDSRDESCLTTLEYIGALTDAEELERNLGNASLSSSYRQRAQLAASGVLSQCWNADLGLVADSPAKDTYSQHANMLAVLYDVAPDGKALMQKVLARELGDQAHQPSVPLTEASYYFRFYLARALEHAGMADQYLSLLGSWRGMLAMGFTTWPEQPGNTRSDSHAWTAHPTYDLLALVAGIEPADAGFAHVKIEPHLADLTSLDATYPHPLGLIQVHYARHLAEIRLPRGLTGTFVWHGQSSPLRSGLNQIDLP